MSSKIPYVFYCTVVAALTCIAMMLFAPNKMSGGYFSIPAFAQNLSRPIRGHEKPLGNWCTNHHLVRYYRDNDSLPGQGTWDGAGNFHPKLCDFRKNKMQGDHIRQCFKRKNVTHVMTMGDSNAVAYNRAMRRLLGRAFRGCRVIRKENMINHPQPSYYSRGNKTMAAAMVAGYRGCWSCISQMVSCTSKLGRFSSEHIGMSGIWDQSLSFRNNSKGFQADSLQEIVMKYYMASDKPDLILLFPPFNHLKKKNHSEVRQGMARTFNHLKQHLPTTRVVWMPAFAEFEAKKNKDWKNRLFDGMLATDRINSLNQDMFKLIRDDLLDGTGKTMSFINLVPVSISRLAWTSHDGVHMTGVWHDKIIEYWLQTFCGS